jgi:hypothetical protein
MHIQSFKANRDIFLILNLLFLLSSCGFDHLTDIHTQDITAPTAKDCGSCHVDQYAEWQKSSHARAFISPEYRMQTDNYQDEECLFCHIPGDVQDPDRQPRQYNREEGITCVSCHLHNGKMAGPHQSGALFTPHAISRSHLLDANGDSHKLCGVCHQETYDQWQLMQRETSFPSCLGCHGALKKRSHTQGTGLFSNILVAFEPEHQVRSHYMTIQSQTETRVYPEVQVAHLDKIALSITIKNNLPHDLPAGIFGEKYLVVSLQSNDSSNGDASHLIEARRIELDDVLAPGESTVLNTSLPKRNNSHDITLKLYRFHQSTQKADLIHTYIFPGVSP